MKFQFVLPFENEADREVHTKYHLPTEEIKGYNVITNGINFLRNFYCMNQ